MLSRLQRFSYNDSEGVTLKDHQFIVCFLEKANMSTLQTVDISHYYDKWWQEDRPNACLDNTLSRFTSLTSVELVGSYRFMQEGRKAHLHEESRACMQSLHKTGILKLTCPYESVLL